MYLKNAPKLIKIIAINIISYQRKILIIHIFLYQKKEARHALINLRSRTKLSINYAAKTSKRHSMNKQMIFHMLMKFHYDIFYIVHSITFSNKFIILKSVKNHYDTAKNLYVVVPDVFML